ncbi:hypothetical protein [Fredinandcohnia sp. 179-A 10B2 NHS]|uniref:hypothetical protein n=1 Tax=Fredinandcohnia sp. 179-A 10B2 NHS TaxID=3235176 RepID=UPI0039A270E5
MKQLFMKLAIIIGIYVLLILVSSLLFPNLSDTVGRIVSGISLVVSLAISTLIVKEKNKNLHE